MRNYLIPAIALLVFLAAGCNPVGMDETRCYVMGRIYQDAAHSTGAEGVTVMTTGTTESYIVETNQNGDFFIEVQMYPQQGESGSSTGIPGYATFGVYALYQGLNYTYSGTTGNTFTVFGGDTLTLYDVDLTVFQN